MTLKNRHERELFNAIKENYRGFTWAEGLWKNFYSNKINHERFVEIFNSARA